MFNRFSSTIVEYFSEHASAVVLADCSGESERTWRDRLHANWKPSEEYLAQLHSTIAKAHIDRLVNHGGWEVDEAQAIVANQPSTQAGVALPTADLIYTFSPRFGEYCPEAIALATRFDQDCNRLSNAIEVADHEGARAVLVAMLDWLLGFVTVPSDRAECALMQAQLNQAVDMDGLLKTAAPLGIALSFLVLSCWDVEFCAGYFERTMRALPLFPLVMPRFAPGIDIDPETGRLLRKGRVPRQRVLEPAMARLIDFVAVLLAWRREGALPQRIPRPKDFAEWCDENLARVYSWRDGSTRFKPAQLAQLWIHALKPDSEGLYPGVPSPMLICAGLWTRLLTNEEDGVSLIDCSADYEKFWLINYERLVAGGLSFGERAWPAYFVERTATLATAPLRQSSGRPI